MSTNTLDHLDDLEIYTQCSDMDVIVQWLERAMDSLTVIQKNKKSCKFSAEFQNQCSQGMIVVRAGGTEFTSIWINSKQTPWKNDIDMARHAFSELGGVVRCVESAWTKGDDPDQWLEISETGEQVIQWITED